MKLSTCLLVLMSVVMVQGYLIDYYECQPPSIAIPIPAEIDCSELAKKETVKERYVKLYLNELPIHHSFLSYIVKNISYRYEINFFSANSIEIISERDVFVDPVTMRNRTRNEDWFPNVQEAVKRHSDKEWSKLSYGTHNLDFQCLIKSSTQLPVLEAEQVVVLESGYLPLSSHRDLISSNRYLVDMSEDVEQIVMGKNLTLKTKVVETVHGTHLYNWNKQFSAHISKDAPLKSFTINQQTIRGYRTQEKIIVSYVEESQEDNVTVSDLNDEFQKYLNSYSLHELNRVYETFSNYTCEMLRDKRSLALSIARHDPDSAISMLFPLNKYKGYIIGMEMIGNSCMKRKGIASCTINENNQLEILEASSSPRKLWIHSTSKIVDDVWNDQKYRANMIELNMTHYLRISDCTPILVKNSNISPERILTEFASQYYEYADLYHMSSLSYNATSFKGDSRGYREEFILERSDTSKGYWNSFLKMVNLPSELGFLGVLGNTTWNMIFMIVAGVISIKIVHLTHPENEIRWIWGCLPGKRRNHFHDSPY